jgi:hypothetical protein
MFPIILTTSVSDVEKTAGEIQQHLFIMMRGLENMIALKIQAALIETIFVFFTLAFELLQK